MSPTSGSSAAMTSAISCFVAEDGSKLSPASASSRSAAIRGGDRRTVEEHPLAGDRAERLADHRVVHDREREVVVARAVLQRDAHRPGAGPRQVVAGSVERVHDPAPTAGTGHAAALLTEDAVVREGGAQAVDDQGLAGEVDVRHEVVGVRLDGVRGDARPLAHLQGACLAGEADGQVVRRVEVVRRAGSSHRPTLAHGV